MTDQNTHTEGEAGAKRKRSRAPLLLALLFVLAAGGGGFYGGVSSLVEIPGPLAALLPGGGKTPDAEPGSYAATAATAGRSASVFVPVEQMVVPLGPGAEAEFLVLETEIEVDAADAATFEHMRPRIRDTFNTFLRAVDEADIEQPSATLRLRAQLLRRVRAIAGETPPRDVLITTFILK